jgi:Protein of unknown function (DUF2384)
MQKWDDHLGAFAATVLLGATKMLGRLSPMATKSRSNHGTRRQVQAAVTGSGKTTSAAKAIDGKSISVSARSSPPRSAWRPETRTQFLIDNVGGVTKLARALDVSPSQPSRWKSGNEVPSPEVAARLLDLEHVVALGMQAWNPEVLMDWMNSANGFLGGARPIEVLRLRGSAEVIDALRSTISGAYA